MMRMSDGVDWVLLCFRFCATIYCLSWSLTVLTGCIDVFVMNSSWTNRILAANDFGSVQVIISRDLFSVLFSGINIVLCVTLSDQRCQHRPRDWQIHQDLRHLRLQRIHQTACKFIYWPSYCVMNACVHLLCIRVWFCRARLTRLWTSLLIRMTVNRHLFESLSISWH